ncbi:MAG: TetR/AcrR family transcriptional regulator [Undibacterium sp.]|uniref:TetR/AcrR family transcriptional regulator n=1 Tax=Undibacterium sp. TaxID=1914977 RepID=UPI00271AC8FB|nr:TetR/AcrR family transcriptional regulator [Undibacterium sp.]MDO8654706.1 TetR/AcrR family transcriptional regulator [Undibacterium sp.]
MVRLAKFNEDHFINAAIEIAAHCGVSSVSISAIAHKTGAPVGSVYHRFESRDTILARAWLKVNNDFRQTVASKWALGDTWLAVASFMLWCRSNPVYAQFLLQCENTSVFNESLSLDLHAQLEAEQSALDACFELCLQNAKHRLLDDNIEAILRFVLIDSPSAIVKPYLIQNRPIPTTIDAMLRASHDAVCLWATPTT